MATKKDYESPTFSLVQLVETGELPKIMTYRRGVGVPIYYDRCKDDKDMLILNEKVAERVRKAILYMEKGASYGDTQKWLQAATGLKISRPAVFYMHKGYLGEKKALKEARRDITRKNKVAQRLINDAKRLAAATAKIQNKETVG